MRHAHPTASSGVWILVVVAVLAVAGILLDQLAYQLIARHLPPVMRFDHWRSLSEVWPGAFSLLLPPFLLWPIKDEPFGRLMKVVAVGLGLFVGGALSNLLSLALRGFVSNFLVVNLPTWLMCPFSSAPTCDLSAVWSSIGIWQSTIFVPADALMWLGFPLALVGIGAQLLRPSRPAVGLSLDAATPAPPVLYLVRHAESEANVQNRICGLTDSPLSERGHEQATDLAIRLSGVRFDRAFSSPLARARQTAEAVLGGRADGPDLTLDPLLVERDYGYFEGMTGAEVDVDPIGMIWRATGEMPAAARPESNAAIAARLAVVWAMLVDLPGKTLVVTHGAVVSEILRRVGGAPAIGVEIQNARVMVIGLRPTPLLRVSNG